MRMMSEGNRAAEDGKREELEGEADMCRQRGNEYFGRRRYNDSIREYSKGIEAISKSEQAKKGEGGSQVLLLHLLNNRSLAYYRQGIFDLALEDACAGLEIDGTNQKSLYRQGISMLMLRNGGVGDDVEKVYKLFELLSESVGIEENVLVPDDVPGLMEQARLMRLGIEHVSESCSSDIQHVRNKMMAEIDGEEDIDVPLALHELSEFVRKYPDSAVTVQRDIGHQVLWYFFNDATAQETAEVFVALGHAAILWPEETWDRLVNLACGAEGMEVARVALNIFRRVSDANIWVKNHLLVLPWKKGDSIVQRIVHCVQNAHLVKKSIGPKGVEEVCLLISSYADTDQYDSTKVLKMSTSGYLVAFLDACSFAKEIVEKQKGNNDSVKEEFTDPELEAKAQLIEKKQAIYNENVIHLRISIINAIEKIFRNSLMVLDELIQWKNGKKMAGQLHHRIVQVGQQLAGQCPKKTTVILDRDMNPTYEKRPYAADFVDNPAGDFLANINLDDSSSIAQEIDCRGKMSIEDVFVGSQNRPPIIELYLAAIRALLENKQSSVITRLLYKAGLMPFCDSIYHFVTKRTVLLAQQISALLVDNCQEAQEAMLSEPNPIALMGVVKFSQGKDIIVKGLREILSVAQSCNGSDFVSMTDPELGILQLLVSKLQFKPGDPDLIIEKKVCLQLLTSLAERTIKHGKHKTLKSGLKLPKGYGWSCIDSNLLQDILTNSQEFIKEDVKDTSLDSLKRGFLGNRKKTVDENLRNKYPAKSGGSNSGNSSLKIPNNITNRDQTNVQSKDVESHNPLDAVESCPEVTQFNHADSRSSRSTQEEDDDVPDLVEVYDSTPAEKVRSVRMQWLAIPERKRIRWEQTSTDISVWVKLPLGTRAKEISIAVSSGSKITATLKWYGKILDGEFYGKVKATDMTWCVEDDEVHIAIPKDRVEHWWKTLIKGWEEKGYYELLQDAVHADERSVSYDDMDEPAKELLDSILERQAYINAGLLDLENSIDDFRIVLSDKSLQGDHKES
eukprot:jgi/Picsp_1/2842/NSC_01068-R1_protein